MNGVQISPHNNEGTDEMATVSGISITGICVGDCCIASDGTGNMNCMTAIAAMVIRMSASENPRPLVVYLRWAREDPSLEFSSFSCDDS